ncbi:MBL fold metallo-hydrolase [Dielma fastidiosa]|uniref:Glyoxylase-like metal-dependent hydrolase (Beta-lactamase superfamily II) n=1 Tax=Dielma fastidiosa TaxID=1034346 RepID=A0A318L3Z5_9FIRM|nr:MBL fold metallo-hydrolase [Dielma fastidiosa]PXX80173.1 glyoxylase-like metal-dependent hydrolase (beta-lactamase superfamily II) [Dielma fastidiosa]
MLVNQDIEQLNEYLYCIKECDSVNRYVVVGSDQAMLIDTGYGFADFRQLIKKITDKPLITVLTHGHPDHGLGAYLFDEVWVHEKDYLRLLKDDNQETKALAVNHRLKKMPELINQMNPEVYNQKLIKQTTFRYFKEGDSFDLGGIVLKIIEIPGHSYGSVALYEETKGWLFTGDTLAHYNIWNQMDFVDSPRLSVLMATYKKLAQMRKIEEIYPAHGEKPIDRGIIDESIDGLKDLLTHHDEDEKIDTFMGTAYRHVYKHFILLYSKAHLEDALENGLE